MKTFNIISMVKVLLSKSLKLLLFGMLSVGFFSCDLSEQPLSSIPAENYFIDLKHLDYAVLGGYESMQAFEAYGQNIWACFDNDTDLSHISGSGAPTGNYSRDFGKSYIMTNAPVLLSIWKLYYSAISRTNEIIENAHKVPLVTKNDTIQRDKLVAETKFLRAFYYFDLVRFFGDVPLVLHSYKAGDNMFIARTPKDSVYAQIVLDLNEAIPALPWHFNTIKDCRATKNSALGYLIKVQLFRAGYSLYQNGEIKRPDDYKSYYSDVVNKATVLINEGNNSLTPKYEDVFKNQCQNIIDPKETIFEIDMFFAMNSSKGGTIGSYNSPAYEEGVYMKTAGYIRTHYMAYSKFAELDLRRDVSIATYRVDKAGNQISYNTKSGSKTYYNSQNWTPAKWRREWQNSDQFKTMSATNINCVLMRYSDILLMKAEALNELNDGPTAEAYELVNQVRRRGYGKPITVPDAAVDMPSNMNKDEFLSYIQDERAREFMFEGIIRRQDLIRWNILKKKLDELKAFPLVPANAIYIKANYDFTVATLFVDGKHQLYPIPQREIRENPLLVQNPGYSE